MEKVSRFSRIDTPLTVGVGLLITFSLLTLNSFAPSLFPLYFLYIILGALGFIIFGSLDFEIVSLFSKHLYIISIFLLILPLVIGQVTRGAVRWIPIGPLTIQPAEIIKPFLLVFFANYLIVEDLDFKRILKALLLLFPPLVLIVIQPSLGVGFLTFIGFVGVILASKIDKKYLAAGAAIFLVSLPFVWNVIAPYQKQRIESFLNPAGDPLGAGYNSIQSMISVGSGGILGRGLGKGAQTQLAFLPEKHTDFIFAAVSEELGFIGAFLLLAGSFFILWRLSTFLEKAVNPVARAFLAGLFLTLFIQTIVNIGMNMGLLPITGLPLPLVSAGGSSLLATLISLGMATRAVKPTPT